MSHAKIADIEDHPLPNDHDNRDDENEEQDSKNKKTTITRLTPNKFKRKPFESYQAYWNYRWEHSNIRKFYLGEGLSSKEVDDVVNALSLVNALILTIPFGVIMSLGSDYWDWVAINIVKCDYQSYRYAYTIAMRCLYGGAYSSMTCIILSVLYYILRPDNDYFDEWYTRGKWPILAIASGTITSIVCMLTLFGLLGGWYTSSTDDFCNTLENNKTSYQLAVVILVVISALSILMMV